MNKRIFFFFFILSLPLFGQESRDIQYIRMYARLAVEEMQLYNIPASITLSQGILETGGGQSRLADIANNHFGIKCKAEWTGKTISHTDDAPNECFRVYNSVQESYRDHSKFLAERPYYKDLFKLKTDDYKSWAHGLKKAGYATNPKYAQILIDRIEKYNLYQFDELKPEEVADEIEKLYGYSDIALLSNYDQPKHTQSQPEETVAILEHTVVEPKTIEVEKRIENPLQRIKKHPIGVEYIVVYENETLPHLAKLYDIKLSKLAAYNELPKNGKLTPGQFLFFGKKKSKGAGDYYKVQADENMYMISQKAGIKIAKLYKLNRMKPGQQPKIGQTLNLKTKKR